MSYETLRDAIQAHDTNVRRIAIQAGIASQDLYQAINGKKPFYPGWRKRVAEALEMSVEELFREEVTRDDENSNN